MVNLEFRSLLHDLLLFFFVVLAPGFVCLFVWEVGLFNDFLKLILKVYMLCGGQPLKSVIS